MGWLSNNWIWILLIGGFVAVHLFGHGHRHVGNRRAQGQEKGGGADGHAGHAAVPAESGQTSDPRRRRRGC
ncbi:hypothetical protein [Phenylobacterium soli]|uniref:DUF2933 domain-containing protein n=1 Tax=Phenylobacterium soli TaxID=2170551 RepID=A0A328AHK0_9CAUL|nr:hypothetical protein DJ017_06135 [Phenylobacterium soli]